MDDREHRPQPKAVGSISRLPIMPRASRDNLRRVASPTKDEASRTNLPRLSSRYGSSSIVPPKPLGESLNRSIAGRFGDVNQSSKNRNRSPVRDALQAAQAAALETTPPSSTNNAPVFDDNDENPTQQEKLLQKRRPRPSLTERTLETMAQIPPSPSPTRRRASIVSHGHMGPPARPASSLQGSRPTTPSGSRPTSPNKQPFKPPGRTSPTKEAAVPSPGSLFSPPRAFVKGGSLRPAKSFCNDQRSVSTLIPPAKSIRVPTNYSAKTLRARPSSHESAHQSLESIFKDPVKPSLTPSRLAVGGSPGNSGLLKPRSIGENTIASSPIQPKTRRNKGNSSKSISNKGESTSQPSSQQTPGKSSSALRETIAKAKAARKSTASGTKVSTGAESFLTTAGGDVADDSDLVGSNEGLLKQRIRGATASGVLNISAMRLNTIPDAVMKMYDPSNEVSVNWSEMVDLVKFNAADNEIEVLPREVFPDWSVDEMADDDEKMNQFGGLEGLDLHNNLLHEIPVGLRRLERLASLNLGGNDLSNKSLDIIFQIPGLQELNLSRNALSGVLTFATGSLQNLRILRLGENKFEELEISDPESVLRVLDVSKNRLRRLPWQTLAGYPITELNVSGNALSGEAFQGTAAGFSQLRECDLSMNAFSSLADSVSDFSRMQVCRLNNNRLTELPDLSKLECLVTLQVAENQLVELPPELGQLDQLRNVDVRQNNIKTIDPSIAMLDSLTSLELSGNPLRDRKLLTMDTADLKHDLQKRFAGNTEQDAAANGGPAGDSLATTYFGDSKDAASGSRYRPSNGTLDLASKGLTSVDINTIDLDSASPPIHTLRLSNNELTVLPFALLSHPALKWSLRSLDLSHNPHLNPTAYLVEDLFLPVLQSLYVVSTGLTSLDALTSHLKAPALTELNISCHRLAGHVPWIKAWFPSCTSLLASDNWFSSIDVEAVRGLEVLDIRNNQIEELPRRIGLLGNHVGKTEPGRLRVLECGGNAFRVPRIMVIEKGTEAVLKDLRRMVDTKDVPDEWKDEI